MTVFPQIFLVMVRTVGSAHNLVSGNILVFAAILGIVVFAASSEAADGAPQGSSTRPLLWGPYKPNLYFGVRPRIPKSLTAGLLWSGLESYAQFQNNVRHTCEQHAGMTGYGWDAYDARKGGTQTFHDDGNDIDLVTSFVKVSSGEDSEDWGLRVKGTPRISADEKVKTTVVFYTSLEGQGSLRVVNGDDPKGLKGDISFGGATPDLGKFKIDVIENAKNKHPQHEHSSYKAKPLDRTFVSSLSLPEDKLWQIKPIFFSDLRRSIEFYAKEYGEDVRIPPEQLFTLSNNPGEGNLHFVQKVFEGSFEFDVLYTSSTSKPMTRNVLGQELNSSDSAFSTRYREIFVHQPPFNDPKFDEFSKSMFSNLLGGIGYFYGDSLADLSDAEEYEEDSEGFWEYAAEARRQHKPEIVGPSELFTSVPSRPFFPRGFLWDEGFHLLPIMDWDSDLTLEVVMSWFNTMDENGWIAREQILGAEARSKVPAEFQVQYPQFANPPTLFLTLEAFLDRMKTVKEEQSARETRDDTEHAYHSYLLNQKASMKYLQNLYPQLQRHYEWFRKTQKGEVKAYYREAFSSKEAYRWRGRTMNHTLTSGLDDYPRAQPPHPGELHVDLLSWMGLMAKSMTRIADLLANDDDAVEYRKQATAITRNLDDLHWSEKDKAYCDATIDAFEEHALVCHKGYISLFPLLAGLVDGKSTSSRLGDILNIIDDPELLWSDYGLRSLSKSDEMYHTGEDYWRGPIWVNINYLVLVRLLDLANTPSAHQAHARDIYSRLRVNIVNTVYKSWETTGFAWEQYNDETGAGQRTQHFTGWTSLVVKIMCMPDLKGGDEGKGGKDGFWKRKWGPDEL